VAVQRNSADKEYHAVGPTIEHELSAKCFYVRGTM